jgi:hypothetical protein
MTPPRQFGWDIFRASRHQPGSTDDGVPPFHRTTTLIFRSRMRPQDYSHWLGLWSNELAMNLSVDWSSIGGAP